MTDQTTIEGFLLTRAARDTARGVELSYWAATEHGPLEIVVGGQEAVCFVERRRALAAPAGVRRVERPLRLLGGGPVDALYCPSLRALETLRGGVVPICESDVPAADRYLMERFVRAGVVARGRLVTRDGARRMIDPVLRPLELAPRLGVVSLDIEIRAGSDELYSIAGARLVADDVRPVAADAWSVAPLAQASGARVPDAVVYMVGRGEDERRDGYTLVYRDSERGALEGFFDWPAARRRRPWPRPAPSTASRSYRAVCGPRARSARRRTPAPHRPRRRRGSARAGRSGRCG